MHCIINEHRVDDRVRCKRPITNEWYQSTFCFANATYCYIFVQKLIKHIHECISK